MLRKIIPILVFLMTISAHAYGLGQRQFTANAKPKTWVSGVFNPSSPNQNMLFSRELEDTGGEEGLPEDFNDDPIDDSDPALAPRVVPYLAGASEGNIDDPWISGTGINLYYDEIEAGEFAAIIVEGGGGEYECRINELDGIDGKFILRNAGQVGGRSYPEISLPSTDYAMDGFIIKVVTINEFRQKDPDGFNIARDGVYACAIFFDQPSLERDESEACWMENRCMKFARDLELEISGPDLHGREIITFEDLGLEPDRHYFNEAVCQGDMILRVAGPQIQEEQYEGQNIEMNEASFLPIDYEHFDNSGYQIRELRNARTNGMPVRRGVLYEATVEALGKWPYTWEYSCPDGIPATDCSITEVANGNNNNKINIKIRFPNVDAPEEISGFYVQATDSCSPQRTVRKDIKFDVNQCRVRNVKGSNMKIFVRFNGGDSDTNKSTKAGFELFSKVSEQWIQPHYHYLDHNGNDVIDNLSPIYTYEISNDFVNRSEITTFGEQICLEDVEKFRMTISHSLPDCGFWESAGCLFDADREKADIHIRRFLAVSCNSQVELDNIFSGDNPLQNTCLFAGWHGTLGGNDILVDWWERTFKTYHNSNQKWSRQYPFTWDNNYPTDWPE